MATLLQIGQNVAGALGVQVPNSFIGNSDATARRILRAASAAGRHLRTRDWRALTHEHTFATVSGTQEYALPTDPAFHHLIPESSFDRSLYRSLIGPQPPAYWQYGEALLTVSGGIEHRFRIKVDDSVPRVEKFFLLDDPAGAYTLAFEYVSHEWIYDGSAAYREDFAADADQPVFDDYLMELETEWRLLRALGEPYFGEQEEANRLADRLYSQEGGETIRMGPRRLEYAENIPEGDWS